MSIHNPRTYAQWLLFYNYMRNATDDVHIGIKMPLSNVCGFMFWWNLQQTVRITENNCVYNFCFRTLYMCTQVYTPALFGFFSIYIISLSIWRACLARYHMAAAVCCHYTDLGNLNFIQWKCKHNMHGSHITVVELLYPHLIKFACRIP